MTVFWHWVWAPVGEYWEMCWWMGYKVSRSGTANQYGGQMSLCGLFSSKQAWLQGKVNAVIMLDKHYHGLLAIKECNMWAVLCFKRAVWGQTTNNILSQVHPWTLHTFQFCGHPMHVPILWNTFLTKFFLLSVAVACYTLSSYTLSRKKKENNSWGSWE